MSWPRPSIVHVNDIASVASTLMAEQRRRGYDVRVIELPKPGASLPDPWKLAFVPVRVLLALASAARLRGKPPSIVHIHYATQAFFGPLAGHPFLVHCHGSDIRDVAPRSLRGRYLRALASRADALLYATPDLAGAAAALRSGSRLLPNPVACDAFARTAAAERDLLLGIRLHPLKGAETAIEGVARMLELRPQTTVTVILNGPLASQAEARLRGNIRFMPPVTHDRMPALFAQHRVALGQFRIPALGQYELEALASGVAVVRPAALPVDPGDPAPMIAASEPEDVARAVAELLGNARDRDRLAEEGTAWVRRHHDVRVSVDILEEVYAGMLERARSRRPGGREP